MTRGGTSVLNAPPNMRIAVRKEGFAGERRVSIVPESIKRLAAKKIDASVEAGAGSAAFASDEDYRAAGARVDSTLDALLADADAVVQIRPPRDRRGGPPQGGQRSRRRSSFRSSSTISCVPSRRGRSPRSRST